MAARIGQERAFRPFGPLEFQTSGWGEVQPVQDQVFGQLVQNQNAARQRQTDPGHRLGQALAQLGKAISHSENPRKPRHRRPAG